MTTLVVGQDGITHTLHWGITNSLAPYRSDLGGLIGIEKDKNKAIEIAMGLKGRRGSVIPIIDNALDIFDKNAPLTYEVYARWVKFNDTSNKPIIFSRHERSYRLGTLQLLTNHLICSKNTAHLRVFCNDESIGHSRISSLMDKLTLVKDANQWKRMILEDQDALS